MITVFEFYMCLSLVAFFQEIEDKTRLISQSDKVKDSDCFIFIILTHGGDEGVFGVDEKSVSVSTLTEMFEPNNCPGLNEKPKIFLIQACRGGEFYLGFTVSCIYMLSARD